MLVDLHPPPSTSTHSSPLLPIPPHPLPPFFFFFQAKDGIRDPLVTGVQTCALPIARTEGRSEHISVEGTQGADSAGGAPGALLPPRASAGFRLRRLPNDRAAGLVSAALRQAARTP